MPEARASSPDPGLMPEPARLRVLLPLPLPQALDYLAPPAVPPPAPGAFVRVPLGSRDLIGVVWDEAADPEVPAERLKAVLEILPTPPLPAELRGLVDRTAQYTLSPPGAVLRMAMSVPEALLPPRPRR